MGSLSKNYSPTNKAVLDIVEQMQSAFTTGSVSRILTSMRSHAPYAAEPNTLMDRMYAMPTLGWSCWDMSVLLVELLKRQGIHAGVTVGFGAEKRAPAQPHSLVRVEDESDPSGTFYSDPYFGVPFISRSPDRTHWSNDSVRAQWSSPSRHHYTDMLFVNHRAHSRPMGYQIMAGVLSHEQLQSALWQAEEFGKPVQCIRGRGDNRLWRIVRRTTQDQYAAAEESTWRLVGSRQSPEVPDQREGNWYELTSAYTDLTAVERQCALDHLFQA